MALSLCWMNKKSVATSMSAASLWFLPSKCLVFIFEDPLGLHLALPLIPTGGRMAVPRGDREPGSYYVGVDVGTGSVRAALVDQRGTLVAFADQPVNQWEPQFNHHEQSSEDIWAACCVVTKVWPQCWHSLFTLAPWSYLLSECCVSVCCQGWHQDNFRHRLCLSGAHSLWQRPIGSWAMSW